MATGSVAASINDAAALATQNPPPWPAAPTSISTSWCEVHREFIAAQLRLRPNATVIYQDLVDSHGYSAAYNCVKRFAAKLRHKEPEQFVGLSFVPGEEMQVLRLTNSTGVAVNPT